ncbi:MAG: hypothetical protein DSY58_05210 [Desulfobulbus sp.]|nr:MAG: hypothetical protein DSY58_05210 [Desulfobulbus sp.]
MPRAALNQEPHLKTFRMIGSVQNARLKKNTFLRLTDLHLLQLACVSCNNVFHHTTMSLFSLRRYHLLLPMTFLLVALFVRQSHAEEISQIQEVIEKSSATAQSFIADINFNGFKRTAGKARAMLIVPKLDKIGFILGATGGTGVLLAHDMVSGKWSYPVFYTIGSISMDIQFGSDTSEIIFLVMTVKGLKALLNTQCKLGKDVILAAGPMSSASDTATKKADILYFRRGLEASGSFSLNGAIIAPRNSWNTLYYKKAVDPADILLRHLSSNPQADALLETLSAAR